MRRTVAFLAACASTLSAGLALAWFYAAPVQLADNFKSDETIQTMTVKLDVGAGGADLEEPVALDLGLGFPLWLAPLGQAGTNPEFGAVPQQSTAGSKLQAGSSATFTFELQPAFGPGLDELRTTPQLLADVRVSDIARVGIASQGANNWILAGYEITINGKPFSAKANIGLTTKDAQDAAQAKLAKLNQQIGPLNDERTDLETLVKAQLATPDDADRLKQIVADLAPLTAEKQRLEGQLQGKYAWFVDQGFVSPWRQNALLQSAKLTLVTCSHPGADTQNYVYLQTGGHKYLLGSPTLPLSSSAGAQEFVLDLIAGPLTAADLRGWAVGMLANPEPYGTTPNRWHPQRIMAQIDGQVVYDSDENALDHNSLEIIRLIPPAHRDADGTLVIDTQTPRELFVWQAGKGLGLDQYPPEKGPPPPLSDEGGTLPGAGAQGVTGDGGVLPGDGGVMPGDGTGGLPPPDSGGWPDPAIDPPPWGIPFQIDSVRITQGWKTNQVFRVDWTVSGNESEIHHYVVALVPVVPQAPVPYNWAAMHPLTFTAPPGSRTSFGMLPPAPYPFSLFLAPIVVGVPIDPGMIPHQRIGPARPIFHANALAVKQPWLRPFYQISGSMPPTLFPVSLSTPWSFGRAVWPAGPVTSHRAILFDRASPGWNIAARPLPGDIFTVYYFDTPILVGHQRLLANVGFLGGPGAANAVTVQMTSRVLFPNHAVWSPPEPPITVALASPPWADVPMPVLEKYDSFTDLPHRLRFQFRISGGAFDPAHPPSLIGLRLQPAP